MDAGHKFNVGVVYLPPSAVRDGVFELIRVNPDIEKIIILTEKVSVHDAREIRALAQQRGVDIFGANCLGVADSWNHVRIGGALGGDKPEETLRKGSVAIYSNSGNFTTTIANYLATGGWGTTTCISSGKDVYIHFAAGRIRLCLANDARTKAAVMYIEPGGYYEQDLEFKKPVVACVVGRWKAKLTRAVGHAGAIAGSGDDARGQGKMVHGQVRRERHLHARKSRRARRRARWSPTSPTFPLALTAVMKLNGIEPDFAARRRPDTQALVRRQPGPAAAAELDIPLVEPIAPYDDADRRADQAGRRHLPARVDEGPLGQLDHGRRRPR